MIFVSSALELELNNNIIMNNLIVDAARDKIFLTFIVSKNIYTCSHENSKINFEKLMILINEFLKDNKSSLDDIVLFMLIEDQVVLLALETLYQQLKLCF